MKTAERIVMVLLFIALVGGGVWIYFAVQYEQENVREAVARGEYEISVKSEEQEKDVPPEDWRVIYPNTVPITISGVPVQASVADTIPERIMGLSDTPFLPDNVVKLFSFGTAGEHSIWMKDMNYSIDIIWVAEEGEIVHIEENVSPDTYPESFASPVPSWFVIEAVAGFVSNNSIKVGDQVVLKTS